MAAQSIEPGGVAKALILGNDGDQASFVVVMQLFDAGAGLIDETGRAQLRGESMLITAQATRALHSFETVIAACVIGRGVQAAMLNRALYDDVLDIHWVAANPKEALERADQHDRLMALAEHQLEDKYGRTDRALNEDEAKELEELVETYGGKDQAFDKPWHRASFEDRLALVQERWSDEPDAKKIIAYMYEVEQRRNNLMLHPSPTAFRQTIHVSEGRRTLNRAGPDSRWRNSLRYACGGFFFCLRVLAEEFDLDRDPMAECFEQATGLLSD